MRQGRSQEELHPRRRRAVHRRGVRVKALEQQPHGLTLAHVADATPGRPRSQAVRPAF